MKASSRNTFVVRYFLVHTLIIHVSCCISTDLFYFRHVISFRIKDTIGPWIASFANLKPVLSIIEMKKFGPSGYFQRIIANGGVNTVIISWQVSLAKTIPEMFIFSRTNTARRTFSSVSF